jgi:hypothetical protein
VDIDGDFGSVPYTDVWPGSISNATADRLLHPTSETFTSPTALGGKNFSITKRSNDSRSNTMRNPCPAG